MSETDEVVVEAPVMIDDTETAQTVEELVQIVKEELDAINMKAVEEVNNRVIPTEELQAQQEREVGNILVNYYKKAKDIIIGNSIIDTATQEELYKLKASVANEQLSMDEAKAVAVATAQATQASGAIAIFIDDIRKKTQMKISAGDGAEFIAKLNAIEITKEALANQSFFSDAKLKLGLSRDLENARENISKLDEKLNKYSEELENYKTSIKVVKK